MASPEAAQRPEPTEEHLAEVVQLPVKPEAGAMHPKAAELREEVLAWQEELQRVKESGADKTGKDAQKQMEREWGIEAIIVDRSNKAQRIESGENPDVVLAEDEALPDVKPYEQPIENTADLEEQVVLHQQELDKVEAGIAAKGTMASGREHMLAHRLGNKVQELMHRRKKANEAQERIARIHDAEAGAEEQTGEDAA